MPIHLSDSAAAQVELVAITDDARAALGGMYVSCRSFPFRLGREQRRGLGHTWHRFERRLGITDPVNDVYLVSQPDDTVDYICARHFQIEVTNGRFSVVDLESCRGTWVNHRVIGGDRSGGRGPLHSGDVIKIGAAESPYRFRFLIGAEDLAAVDVPVELRQSEVPGSPLQVLTDRERQVLALLATGVPSHRIAYRLSISPNTVRNHVHHILDKLGVHTRLAAVAIAHRHGLVSLDAPVAEPRADRRPRRDREHSGEEP